MKIDGWILFFGAALVAVLALGVYTVIHPEVRQPTTYGPPIPDMGIEIYMMFNAVAAGQ